MRVLFRADASAGIGSGHWIRCRSLARSLRSEGADVRFCGRAPAGVFRESLAREFRLIALPSASDDSIDPSKGCWIDVTEQEDARLTFSAVEADGEWRPDWIVVDHYGLSSLWHQCLRESWTGVRIGVIDDLADRSHDADLVDHNIFQGDLASRYQNCFARSGNTSLPGTTICPDRPFSCRLSRCIASTSESDAMLMTWAVEATISSGEYPSSPG